MGRAFEFRKARKFKRWGNMVLSVLLFLWKLRQTIRLVL